MAAPAAGASAAAGAAAEGACWPCCCWGCCWGSITLHMRGLVSAGTASIPAYCLTADMGVALGCSSASQDSAAAALKLATAGEVSLLQRRWVQVSVRACRSAARSTCSASPGGLPARPARRPGAQQAPRAARGAPPGGLEELQRLGEERRAVRQGAEHRRQQQLQRRQLQALERQGCLAGLVRVVPQLERGGGAAAGGVRR
jgi:hypothetical protein